MAAVVGALLVAAGCAPPGGSALDAPGTVVLGLWAMDEAAGPTMIDTAGAGRHGSIGAGVAPGNGTYRFPGWTGNVDGGGRLTGHVPVSAGLVSIPDPGGVLQPGRGAFSIALRLRSALTAAGRLPTGPGASFNVVQKGRADQHGGFWKLELVGDGAGTGHLRWVVSDGTPSAVVTSRIRVDDGRWHSVTAELRGGRAVLAVDGLVAAVPAGHVGEVAPGDPPVSIGKKPGSTDPGDAFAGWLDDLVIAR